MSEARHFGYYFRQRREERGLSLREVENAISIRCVYLDAIEQGTIASMLSPVYAKGFVRQYANFLGLDGDRFLQEYGHLFNAPQKEYDIYSMGTLQPRSSQGPNLSSLPGVVWLLIAVLGVTLIYMLLLYLDIV